MNKRLCNPVTLSVYTLRQLAIELLDDDDGVNSDGFDALVMLLQDNKCQDILDAVEASEDRFFLNEDDAHELRMGDHESHVFVAGVGVCKKCGITVDGDNIENNMCIPKQTD